jgi:hypothetical protein
MFQRRNRDLQTSNQESTSLPSSILSSTVNPCLLVLASCLSSSMKRQNLLVSLAHQLVEFWVG